MDGWDRSRLSCVAAALIGALAAAPALADPGLLNRRATLQVLTYDDPARPLLESAILSANVGAAVEFFADREPQSQNGLNTVPVAIDLRAARIEGRYAVDFIGDFAAAAFNGYVIQFDEGCDQIVGARLDADATTMALTPDRIMLSRQEVRINVSGLRFSAESRFAIDLAIEPCPVS